MNATETTTNGTSHQVGVTNSTESATTVSRSVTKVAEMTSWPRSVRASPVSTATAQMTATEVVDRAMPAIRAAGQFQPSR